ncbi:MAG: SufD family Fe-S cluster assembly protein [Patescibacteria group bacterium]|nr:SufD family Fe-S cluster assembly protein [Patescibacteria group bacterium]
MKTKTIKLNMSESKELVLKNEDTSMLVNLIGDQSEISVTGRFLLTGNTERNINIVLNHIGINTKGRVDIKVVLHDKAKLYFNGCLIVNTNAIGTDTHLSQKNLLVGEEVFVKSIPSLEIKNAKVKASHGVTIGKVSEDEIYYMESRGLSHIDAEQLITSGFLEN